MSNSTHAFFDSSGVQQWHPIQAWRVLFLCIQALLLRESMGISADETVRAFKETEIQAFVERPPMQVPVTYNVYTSIDPSGGGASAFAVCSIVISSNGSVAVRAALV